MRTLMLFAAGCGVFALSLQARPLGGGAPAEVNNLGDVDVFNNAYGSLEGGYGTYYTHETTVDLNGDGDVADFALVVYDAATGQAHGVLAPYTGLFVRHDGSRIAFVALEATNGATDWNGDGDATDRVVVVHDAATGVTLPVGLASHGPALAGSLVAFSVEEASQGAGVDLNGDGDTNDAVPHVLDVSTMVLRNVGLATYSFITGSLLQLSDGHLLFAVAEAQQGQDLNGDGDKFDAIWHLFHFASNTVQSLGFSAEAGFSTIDFAGGRFGLRVVEAELGTDLTADSDLDDWVTVIVDGATGQFWNPGFNGSVATYDSRRLVLGVFEGIEGQDLNGDGDTSDEVLLVHDVLTKASTVLPHAAYEDKFATWSNIVLGQDAMLFRVREEAEGGTDLNGDGDAKDRVLFTHTYGGATQCLGLAGLPVFAGPRALVEVDEREQGRIDLTGDGEITSALHIVDVATGARQNLGMSGSLVAFPYEPGASSAVPVFLTDEEGVDRNGDGLSHGKVVEVVDVERGCAVPSGVSAYDVRFAADESAMLYVEELLQNSDLNGDSLVNDVRVVHGASFHPGNCGELHVSGSGCAAGLPSAPGLAAYGCAIPDGVLSLAIVTGPPGGAAFLAVSAQKATLLLPGGCPLAVGAPYAGIVGPLALGPTGGFRVNPRLPASLSGLTFHAQALVPAAAGVATSPALEVVVR